MAKAEGTVAKGQIELDPSVILADDNTRYSLKDTRIHALAASIKATGGVMVPVEVEPLTPAVNGQKYRLTTGYYRHAAVSLLNKDEGAGLTLPAIIQDCGPYRRMKRQLAENMERENQSPMDQAIAIKKLLDAGVPKIEVRELFQHRGHKGKMQPASNSFINISLSFLDLPKDIQREIHSGTVGVADAYRLTKLTPDKQKEVIEEAKAQREKEVEWDEKRRSGGLPNKRKQMKR